MGRGPLSKGARSRYSWPHFVVVFLSSVLICCTSLGVSFVNGGRYISVLSWNLFFLQELFRYCFHGTARSLTAPASLSAVGIVAVLFTFAAWLVRAPESRRVRFVVAIVLGFVVVVWFPFPWENL